MGSQSSVKQKLVASAKLSPRFRPIWKVRREFYEIVSKALKNDITRDTMVPEHFGMNEPIFMAQLITAPTLPFCWRVKCVQERPDLFSVLPIENLRIEVHQLPGHLEFLRDQL